MRKFGFFKPYGGKRGGVCEEPWHISYAPISLQAREDLTMEMVEKELEASDICGKETILKMLPDIYREYIKNVDDF